MLHMPNFLLCLDWKVETELLSRENYEFIYLFSGNVLSSRVLC